MNGMPRRNAFTGEDLFRPIVGRETESQQSSDLEPITDPRLYEQQSFPRRRASTSASGDGSIPGAAQAAELRDECVALARRARDAFKDACSAVTPDGAQEAEASFASAKSLIEGLWEYAYLRDQPFRDLLALLDAALKRTELAELTQTQRDVLRQAFADLPRWMLDDTTVEGHIERFAEHEVDITGPLRAAKGKKFRVTFEAIEE